MLEYLLFDLDGTLTDSSEGITKSVQYALKSVNIEVEDLTELYGFIGPSLEYSFKHFYDLTPEQTTQAITKYRERYDAVGKFENMLYPGIVNLLKDMKKQGKHLAIASGKPEVFVRQILKHFHVEQYFEVIVGSTFDGRLASKEAIVAEALKQLGVTDKAMREKTAMIGDRHFDIIGGKSEGLVTIGVEYGFANEGELKEAKADYIVKTVRELHDFLMRGSTEADEMRMQEYEQAKKKSKLREEACRRKAEREVKVQAKSSFSRALYVLAPLALYFLTYNIVGFLVSWGTAQIGQLLGPETFAKMQANEQSIIQGIRGIFMLCVTCLVMFPLAKWEFFLQHMARPVAKPMHGVTGRTTQQKVRTLIVLAITAISTSFAGNLVFELFHIVEMSSDYVEVVAEQRAIMFGIGIVLYVFVSPLAEELLFRGLLYNRMKLLFPKTMAMVLSALFFGLYHGNIVQGSFGVICGLAMVWLYEICGKWYVPVLFHSLVNLVSYLLPYMAKSMVNPFSCAVFLAISVAGLWWFYKQQKEEQFLL